MLLATMVALWPPTCRPQKFHPGGSIGARPVLNIQLYVFFIIHHGTREIVHARVTARPNAQWLAQQVLEACGLSTDPPRFLIHDLDLRRIAAE